VKPPRAEYAFNGDVAIAYGVVGDGPIDLVYIQGFVSDVELMWDCRQAASFFERISGWARLITIDRRGTGMSDRFSADRLPPLEDAAADVLAVMDAVDSPRASIFGHHEGGQLGAMLAATHPERVRTLSLFATAASWETAARNDPEQPAVGSTDEIVEQWRHSFGTRADEQDLFDAAAPSHRGDGELYRFLSRLMRHAASPDSAVGFLRLLFETDITGILSSIEVPTQVLHRVDDRILPVGYGRELADAIHGARFIELSGGDWWPFLGDTDELLTALEGFVIGGGAGAARPSKAERSLATVLFTDIVGSTERSAEMGDQAWNEVRARHDQIVREAISRSDGHEVKTLGDGFLATFDGPARAVECSVRIVREVEHLGIEIRAGLHAGEVTVEDGDIAGIAVAIGARIASLAGPSEILVSRTVKDLTAGSHLTFEDAGDHELKGVPDTWRLYRVVD
jgi:class 3 adenylate cyclase/pimeloyl-ACP methyl ester carboxylesterase